MRSKIKYIFLLLLIIPNVVFAAGMTVNKSSVTLEVGTKTTFKVTLNGAAGRINITSSNGDVATVSKNKLWLDKSSETVTINAKSVGKSTIKIATADVTTYDDKDLNSTKTVTVNVINKRSSNNNLSDLRIDGKTISNFSSSRTSYSINNETKSITITATASDTKAKISGTGTKTIKEGKNKFIIKVTAENGSVKKYTIIVNKKVSNTNNSEPVEVTNIENEITYTIRYDDNRCEPTIAKEGEYWKNLCVVDRDGYTFNSWKDENGNIVSENVKATKDLNVHAEWSLNVSSKSNKQFSLSYVLVSSILSFILGIIITMIYNKNRK